MKQFKLFSEKKFKYRKIKRALSTRDYNHVILKSRIPLLRRNHTLIKSLVAETQARFEIKLYSLAIMEDHLHFLIQISNRTQFANALRFLAGMIALKLKKGKIWRQRAWSRVVKRGRDYLTALRYVWMNPIKAEIFSDEIDSWMILGGELVLYTSETEDHFAQRFSNTGYASRGFSASA